MSGRILSDARTSIFAGLYCVGITQNARVWFFSLSYEWYTRKNLLKEMTERLRIRLYNLHMRTV